MSQGRLKLRGFLAGAVTTVLSVGIAPVSAHAAASPSIVVKPNHDLVSGQTVHVTGSGFTAHAAVVAVECALDAETPLDCDITGVSFATADVNGNLKTKVYARRTLYTYEGLTDCALSACELLLAPTDDFTTHATAAIAFDPSVTLPPTTLKATPATDLLHLQSVKVTGTGFTPNAFLDVQECVVESFSCGPYGEGDVGSDGRFTTSLVVQRVLTNADGERFDCASAPGACELVAFDFENPDYHATAPLAFDASVPPPPAPTLKVTPKANLPYYARVTVTGKHWSPDNFVDLLQCSSKTFEACSFVRDGALTNSNGSFSTEPVIGRMITDIFGGPTVDCAAPGAHCVLIVQDGAGDLATVPVSFDPDAPIPPPPTVTTTPPGPFRSNQIIRVKGRNFAPEAGFDVSECVDTNEEGVCISESTGSQVTSANGSFASLFQVARRVESFDGSIIDCNDAGVTCTLQVSGAAGAFVSLPLTFKTGGAADTAAPRRATSAMPRRAGWVAAAQSRWHRHL